MTRTRCDVCGKIIEIENAVSLDGGDSYDYRFIYKSKNPGVDVFSHGLYYEVCGECNTEMKDYEKALLERCGELIAKKFPKYMFDKMGLEKV